MRFWHGQMQGGGDPWHFNAEGRLISSDEFAGLVAAINLRRDPEILAAFAATEMGIGRSLIIPVPSIAHIAYSRLADVASRDAWVTSEGSTPEEAGLWPWLAADVSIPHAGCYISSGATALHWVKAQEGIYVVGYTTTRLLRYIPQLHDEVLRVGHISYKGVWQTDICQVGSGYPEQFRPEAVGIQWVSGS